ncbi:MAG: PKD domain-containing protein [Bacteriovoracaceae bacterium]|nr:PKD domain-containing protein [Bacteriovoracaceae bacterium]
MREIFNRISGKIRKRVANQPELAAEYRLPIQVGNKVAGPLYYATIISGFKYQMLTVPGSLIEGEQTKIQTRITNLRHLPSGLPEGSDLVDFYEELDDGTLASVLQDNRDYAVDYFYKKNLVHHIDPQKLPEGSSIEYIHPTGKMNPSDFNKFNIQFYRKNMDDDVLKRWGRVKKIIPVAVDKVIPEWSSIIPTGEEGYIKTFPIVSASVKDDFGKIDPATIKILLNGNDVTARLLIETPEEGQKYDISGDLNPLADGSYTISFEAKDFARNQATPYPLERSLVVDHTAPVISKSELPSLTNVVSHNLDVNISDISPTTTTVKLNGNTVIETDNNNFQMQLSFIEGDNKIEISSVDAAGNISETIIVMVKLDTLPPILTNVLPENGDYLNSKSIQIHAFSNESLSLAKVNDVVMVIAADKKNISGTLTAVDEGNYNLNITVTDLAGNVTTVSKTIIIDTISPKITINKNDNIVTNNSNFNLQVVVDDSSPVNSTIIQNNNQVYQTNSKSFNYSAVLSDGVNVFAFNSTDLAGNKAVIVNLNNVVLDTKPPMLSEVSPTEGEIIRKLSFPVYAVSNEVLQKFSINGVNINLSPDKKNISSTFTVKNEGHQTLVFSAQDVAGNITNVTRNIEVNLNKPPEVKFISIREDENRPRIIKFDASTSIDDKGIVKFELYVNNKLVTTTTNSRFEYEFPSKTNYSVKMRAYDVEGLYGELTSELDLNNVGAPANFEIYNGIQESLSIVLRNISEDFDGNIIYAEYKIAGETVKINDLGGDVPISFEFKFPGEYTVELFVTDDSNITTLKKYTINVGTENALNPIVDLKAIFISPLEYVFDLNGSFSPSGSDWIATINYGDGQIENLYDLKLAKHKYSVAGVYTVSVDIIDINGNQSSNSFEIEISSTSDISSLLVQHYVDIYSKISDGINVTHECYTFNQKVLCKIKLVDKYRVADEVLINWGDKNEEVLFSDILSNQDILAEHDFATWGSFAGQIIINKIDSTVKTFNLNFEVANPNLPKPQFYCNPGNLKISCHVTTNHINDIVEYLWTFGDDTSDSGKDIIHNYAKSDEYDVTLTVIDSEGNQGSVTNQINVDYFENQAPVAKIECDLNDQEMEVSCHAYHSSDPDGFIVKYEWDMGNGVTQNGIDISHEYSEGNTYTVKLTVTDNWGKTHSSFKDFIIEDYRTYPPVSIINCTPRSPLGIICDASGSYDIDGIISNFKWSFGNEQSSSGEVVNYTYEMPGDYLISLETVDNSGLTTLATSLVTVEDIEHSPLESQIKCQYLSYNSISCQVLTPYNNSPNLTYSWDMNDGTILSTKEIQHIYAKRGTYNIVLGISDPDNNSTATYTIRINEPPVAGLVVNSSSFVAPTTIKLDASNSYDDSSIVSYVWKIDDGQEILTKVPTLELSISDPGPHIVKLSVYDDEGKTASISNGFQIIQNTPPEAAIIVSPVSGIAPLNVVIDASNSIDDEGITKYKYDISDGKVIESSNSGIEHTFQTNGNFNIDVTVFDRQNKSSSTQAVVRVNATPECSFITNKLSGIAPLDIIFDASSSDDDTGIKQYKWIINDVISINQIPLLNHTFTEVGEYQVILEVEDIEGAVCTSSRTISVSSNNAPIASISSDKSNGTTPLGITFSATSSSDDENIISYEWNFGDGYSETTTVPYSNHIYETVGEYAANLVVTDRQGLQDQTSMIITINEKLDKNPPVMEFLPNGGIIETKVPSINIVISDDSPIDFNLLKILINSASIDDTMISIDATRNIITLNITDDTILNEGINYLSVQVSDIHNNMALESTYYNVVLSDKQGPIVNFSPGGGKLETTMPEIIVFISDGNGVNFDSLEIKLNDSPVPDEKITMDASTSRVYIRFDESFSLPNDQFSVIEARVQDELGNVGIGLLGLDSKTNTIFNLRETDKLSFADTCLILEDGKLSCWGKAMALMSEYTHTQTQVENEHPSAYPTLDLGEKVIQVSHGDGHICALLESENIKCWGNNYDYQLGYDKVWWESTGKNLLLKDLGYVSIGEPVKKVIAGNGVTCVILESGNLKCWGRNYYGELGYADFYGVSIPGSPSQTPYIGDDENISDLPYIDIGGKVKDISIGANHMCAILETDDLICWGRNINGECGKGEYGYDINNVIGDNETPASLGPIDFEGVKVKNVSAGYHKTCAVFENKQAKCWGTNSMGELGYGNTDIAPFPSMVDYLDFGEDVKNISSGYRSSSCSCALLESNNIKCWGYARGGQLGYGNEENIGDDESVLSVGYVKLGEGVEVEAVFIGGMQSCAVDTLGRVKCWGWNYYNSLGYGPLLSQFEVIGDDETPADMPFLQLPGVVKTMSSENTTAYFDVGEYWGIAPFTLNVTAWTPLGDLGTSAYYEWDFGDGTPVSDNLYNQSPNHTYSEPGTYIIRLSMYVDNTLHSMHEQIVTVHQADNFLISRIYSDIGEGSIPLKVTFDGRYSVDGNGQIDKMIWDFGDGNTLETTWPDYTVEHTYADIGVYGARLTVIDNEGNESISEPQLINVLKVNDYPIASFSCIEGDYSVSCNALGSSDPDGEIVSYLWIFEDGFKSSGVTVEHDFLKPGKGIYNVKLIVVDDRNARSILNKDIVVDKIAPIISVNLEDNLLTKDEKLVVPISVIDDSSVNVSFYLNDTLVYSGSDNVLVYDAILDEGKNTIKVVVKDNAGNAGEILFNNIVRDTTPPVISNVSPAQGANPDTLTFSVSGQSNEQLSTLTANGVSLKIGGDKKSFSGHYTASSPEPFFLNLTATDIAGNSVTINHPVGVDVPVLIPSLISVEYDSKTDKCYIIGKEGASRIPQQIINADAGFFNDDTSNANNDGSFKLEVGFFSSAKVWTINPATNEREEVIVNYSGGTDNTLSGVVKDTTGRALPNVKISVGSSGISTFTGLDGSFSISAPPSGDQVLQIDGTTVIDGILGDDAKFSKTNIAVSLSKRLPNVLDRVIYLAPMYDNTSQTVISGEDTTITSPNAPHVAIEIDADVTVLFPDGTNTGKVNIAEVSKERTTVPVPLVAEPDNVYAFEPSGLTFSKPVQLELPNDNDFPINTEIIIFSKNSQKGVWEIDGVAKVDEDGVIRTKEGMGITHFSEIFAAPVAPQISFAGVQDRPGADTFNGAMSTSIKLPGYKIMGNDITPNLIYKSNWAHPNVVVSNVIKTKEEKITLQFDSSRNLRTIGKTLVGENEMVSYPVPSQVKAQFTVNGITSSEMYFTSGENESVNDTFISYSLDLSDLSSGAHPYTSLYELKFKNITIRTGDVYLVDNITGSRTVIMQKRTEEQSEIDKIFPSTLSGTLYVQNKKDSSAGQGWKLGGIQKIVNPNDIDKLILEESNGEMSIYGSNSGETSLETIYVAEDKHRVISVDNWPEIYTVNKINEVKRVDFDEDGQYRAVFDRLLDNYNGYAMVYSQKWLGTGNWWLETKYGDGYGTLAGLLYVQLPSQVNKVIKDNDGLIFLDTGLSSKYNNKGGLIKHNGSKVSIFGGHSFPSYNMSGIPDLSARADTYSAAWSFVRQALNNMRNFCHNAGYENCYTNYEEMKNLPFTFFVSRLLGFKRSYEVSMDYEQQSPKDAVEYNGKIYTTHPGSNQIFAVNKVSTQAELDKCLQRISFLKSWGLVMLDGCRTFQHIAGNGEPVDAGDYGNAIQAGIDHPRGIAFDNNGNMFVSTKSGKIRMVATDGKIYPIAGKTLAEGGILSNRVAAEDAYFNEPYGLMFDNDNNYLYVADTGNHRVVKIDLKTKMAITVAGGAESCRPTVVGHNYQSSLNASLCAPTFLGFDDYKNLLILDSGTNSVRKLKSVDGQNTKISYAPARKDNSQLVRLADGTFVRTLRNGTKITFDTDGNQILSEDRVGRKTYFEYENNNPISITDQTGSRIKFIYQDGKLAEVVDPANQSTTFYYDDNRMAEAVFPDGGTRKFQYLYDEGKDGLISNVFDAKGVMTSYVYNDWLRLSRVVQAVGTESETETILNDSGSQSVGNNCTIAEPCPLPKKGVDEEQVYDSIIDNDGSEMKFVKDENGYVSEVIDPLNRKTKVVWNLDGKPIKVERDDGTYVNYKYDEKFGDLIERFDSETGFTSTYLYDSYGNLQREVSPGKRISYSYDENMGLLKSTTDELAELSTFYQYFNSGVKIGLVENITNSEGKRVQFDYDNTGNVIKITNPKGKLQLFARDIKGNITSITDENGKNISRQYDTFNRLTEVEDRDGNVTKYNYSIKGELEKITDPFGKETSYQHDSLGRVKWKRNPLGHESRVQYDNSGNVSQLIDPNENVTTFEYDTVDRLIKKVLADNTYEYSYDERDRLIMVKNNNSKIDYSYTYKNGNSLVESETLEWSGELAHMPSQKMIYQYDDLGNLTIVFENNIGIIHYSYDKASRLTGVKNHKYEEFLFDYDFMGRITKTTRHGSYSTYSYDTINLISSIKHFSNDTQLIQKAVYTRDHVGNNTAISTVSGAKEYSYDENYQVVGATNSEAQGSFASEIFAYDKIGNRTNNNSGVYLYDNTQQLLQEDYKYIYQYDNNGNMVGKNEKPMFSGKPFEKYYYSSENQLVKIEWYENNVIVKKAEYSYDVTGRRVEKKVVNIADTQKSFTRRFSYLGNHILNVFNQNNTLLAKYTYSGMRMDDVLSVEFTDGGVSEKIVKNAGSYFYLKDEQGTITDIVDKNGQKLQHYVYSTFGKLLKITDTSGANISHDPVVDPYFTYTGREHDKESGLYYYRARYYDSSVGRFLQIDPHPGKLSLPLAVINKYAYVTNNPINYIDPFGKFRLDFGFARISMSDKHAVQAVSIAIVATIAIMCPPSIPIILEFAAMGAVFGAGIALATDGEWERGMINGAIGGALIGATGFMGQKAAIGMGATAGSELALLGGGLAAGTANGLYRVEAEEDRDGFLIGFGIGFIGGMGGAWRVSKQTYQNYKAWEAGLSIDGGGDWALPRY